MSKAFGCLPPKLLLSYLNYWKQSVKVKGVRSILQLIKTGVPEGSILGPILFNFFINDIYYAFQSDLHNFADDNAISAISDTVSDLVNALTDKANKVVDWSHVNKMIARTQSHFTHKK